MNPDDEKLKSLSKKIENAKSGTLYKQATAEDGAKPNGGALQIGLELLAGVGVGGLIGFFIDKYLETLPLFFIVCLLFGFAGGFWNIIKQSRAN